MDNQDLNKKVFDMLTEKIRSGRASHALLIEGTPGCGKLALAKETARGLLCTAESAQRPCGVCRDCGKVARDIHPDVLVYEGESGAARSFHVDTVREIRAQAYVMPNEGACKVLILRDVQNMTAGAQNALLKIIEEPPKNVNFILTCDNKAKILPTILSRVSAVSLSGQNEKDRQKATEILFTVCTGSEADALVMLAPFEKDRAGLYELTKQIKSLCADIMSDVEINHSDIKKLRGRLTSLQLLKIIDIMEALGDAIDGNVSGVLLVTLLSSKIKQALM